MKSCCRNCKYWEPDVVGYDGMAPDGEHGPYNCRVHLTDTTDDDWCNKHCHISEEGGAK